MFDLIYRYDPNRTVERLSPCDADEACSRLVEGNRAFAELANQSTGTRIVHMTLQDMGVDPAVDVPTQGPFAVVLGCSDARVPIELIFDRSCNEIFVVRVAGNVLSQEGLGSIDYAVKNLGTNLKLIVVLGHSRCGAVTAAVDAYMQPAEYLNLLGSHHVRAIVNDLMPAVRAAAKALVAQWGEPVLLKPNYRAALIEVSSVFNAAIAASILRQEFSEPGVDRKVVFAVYDLATRRVQVPHPGDEVESVIRLLEPQTEPKAVTRFATEVVSSPLIRRLLEV